MRPPPNLSDPAERAAYRRELRGVALGWRVAGLGLLAATGAVIVARPAWRSAAIALLAVAVALLLVAIAKRTRHHARRMRGDA